MKRRLVSIGILLIVWYIASLHIGKEVILPLPTDVFLRMIELCQQPSFYTYVGATFFRVFLSLLIASLGIFLGIFAGLSKSFDEHFTIFIEMIQIIPQIAFILILIVWLRSATALIVIILLMIFPMFYHNARNGILNIDRDLKDVITLYHHSFAFNLFKVYIPLIKMQIQSAYDNAIPVAFKVGVMAEVFVASQNGIGHALYIARTSIDMTSIFAWVIWMMILLQAVLWGYRKIAKIARSS